MSEYSKALAEINERTSIAGLNLQEILERHYGVSTNPRRQRLFELTWEYGHSAGAHEVLSYYDDMVSLIR